MQNSISGSVRMGLLYRDDDIDADTSSDGKSRAEFNYNVVLIKQDFV